MAEIDVSGLAERVVAREPVAVARAISVVEDRRAESQTRIVTLLGALVRRADPLRAHRVGITGPPGVGKSSLVSALAREARKQGRTVGVLAVDPSSPRSGGALLGDRARIEVDPNDEGMYVRSMASGGYLGGLARAAGAAVEVLSVAYDLVIVETTGVGQSETDVEHVTDTVLMVVQPASGDVLQFLKAGIIEVPDLFAVNKADLGDVATRAVADLMSALGTGHAATGRHVPPVLATSASTGAGIVELLAAIDAHRAEIPAGALRDRRVARTAAWAFRLYSTRHGEIAVERAGGVAPVLAKLREIIAGGATAVEAVARMAEV